MERPNHRARGKLQFRIALSLALAGAVLATGPGLSVASNGLQGGALVPWIHPGSPTANLTPHGSPTASLRNPGVSEGSATSTARGAPFAPNGSAPRVDRTLVLFNNSLVP